MQNACPVGTASTASFGGCLNCNNGTYQNATGQGACSVCPAGTYAPADGCAYTGCITCPAGYYCPAGLASPTICPAGVFCPAGTGSYTNLALGKTATLSSQYPGGSDFSPGNAVDGSTICDGLMGSSGYHLALSNPGTGSGGWWMVDLGGSAKVTSVVIWGRSSQGGATLSQSSNLEIRVGNDPTNGGTNNPVCASGISAPWTPSGLPVACSATGRYLTVDRMTSDYLALCEVQAFGSYPVQTIVPGAQDFFSQQTLISPSITFSQPVVYTLSFWFKFSSLPCSSEWENLFLRGASDSDRTPGIFLHSGQWIHYRHSSAYSVNDGIMTGNSRFSANTWYHQVVTVNVNVMTVYTSGMFDITYTSPGQFNWGTSSSSFIAASAVQCNSQTTSLRDVMWISSYAVASAAEAAVLMNMAAPPVQFTAATQWFDVSSVSGVTWPNWGSGGLNATLSGTTIASDGAYANGLSSSGLSFLTGSSSSTISFPYTIYSLPFTACVMTRYTNNGNNRIVQGTQSANWILGHHNGAAGVSYLNSWATVYSPDTNVASSNWVWICVSAPVSGNVSIFVNGNNMNSGLSSSNTAPGVPLGINAGGCCGEYSGFAIAKLVSWSTALDATTLAAVSLAGLPRCSAGQYASSSGCTNCPAGQYSSGSSGCIACSAGYYCLAGTSKATRTPCPSGTFSPYGSSSSSSCLLTVTGSVYFANQGVGPEWVGSDIAQLATSNPDVCGAACMATPGCTFFIISVCSPYCWLKGNRANYYNWNSCSQTFTQNCWAGGVGWCWPAGG